MEVVDDGVMMEDKCQRRSDPLKNLAGLPSYTLKDWHHGSSRVRQTKAAVLLYVPRRNPAKASSVRS